MLLTLSSLFYLRWGEFDVPKREENRQLAGGQNLLLSGDAQ
jgi:hypothetical protein